MHLRRGRSRAFIVEGLNDHCVLCITAKFVDEVDAAILIKSFIEAAELQLVLLVVLQVDRLVGELIVGVASLEADIVTAKVTVLEVFARSFP